MGNAWDIAGVRKVPPNPLTIREWEFRLGACRISLGSWTGSFLEALRTAGAVLLEGPKACGKTQTA